MVDESLVKRGITALHLYIRKNLEDNLAEDGDQPYVSEITRATNAVYPVICDEKGRPKSPPSIFPFVSGDSLEEVKPIAVRHAIEQKQRQFIISYRGKPLVVGKREIEWEYFKDCEVLARFAASGKETTPRRSKGE